MKINLPLDVSEIIRELEKCGFEGFAVGGCVRDSILGRTPDDWDITTSAKPEEIKKIFPRTVDTGIAHGTVTVLWGSGQYEVTTYRIDGVYSDGRHPDSVSFTANLTEDLKRRDFTVNAMAYNDTVGLVDEFDGMGDIERKIIRCVGEAGDRFDEDALRIFRAVRFSAQLGFDIFEDTRKAIKEKVPNLANVSAERIQTELVKLVVSPHPEKIRDCYELGITGAILPEFDLMMKTPQNNKHHCYSVGEHTIKVMENVEATRVLRLTALFHDVGKPVKKTTDDTGSDHFYGHPEEGAHMTYRILKRLKFDNDTISKVKALIKWHDTRPEPNMKSVRRFLSKVGEDLFLELLEIKRADILGQSDYMREEKLDILKAYETFYKQILEDKQCVKIKDLAIDGNDLIGLGIPKGVEIGHKLSALLDMVIDDPELNKREILISLIAEHKV